MMIHSSLKEVVEAATVRLEHAGLYFGHGTDNAWDEAAYLALFALGLPPNTALGLINELTAEQSNNIERLIDQRIQTGKPAPYLTHEAWFCGLRLYVDERVMIPRSPIAELISNKFSPWLTAMPKNILDLCTGSGAIAIACAKTFSEASIDAVDISGDALIVAKKNVDFHRVASQINLIQSNLFEKVGDDKYQRVPSKRQVALSERGNLTLKREPLHKYDLIISNPPYVSFKEMQTLPREYAFEPTIAFAGGGEEGLELVERILMQSKRYLKDSGFLIVEVGKGRETLARRYPKMPFTWLEFECGGEGVFLLAYDNMQPGQ